MVAIHAFLKNSTIISQSEVNQEKIKQKLTKTLRLKFYKNV